MKNLAFTILALTAIATAYLFYIRASPPPDWTSLQPGDSIAEAKRKVPELEPDGKDGGMNQWYSASRTLTRGGISYDWHMSVTFDANGRLTYVDGRSYNHFLGKLDSTIRR